MTTDALRSALGRLQFRPGWRFFIVSDRRGPELAILAEVDTADGKTAVERARERIPPMNHDTQFYAWVGWLLEHIAAEHVWRDLRVDGKPVTPED